jgi:TonB family protein
MGICLISTLLVIAPQSGLVPLAGAPPVFFQIEPFPRRYGDSPQPSSISRMHITESVSAKLLLKKVEPEFPSRARAAGVEGDVVFRIVIGTNGRVAEIHLRRGKPLLIEAAAKAVSQWQYEIYMFHGEPAEVETSATVQFRLSNKHQ